ncbi:hypothetical protein PISMIDRAFT_50968, partial [Pisolithus microcarpus 441]
PFRNDDEEEIFFVGLCEVLEQDITADNFGLTPAEWDREEYPMLETIHVGHCTAKDIDISLAEPVW